MGYFDDINGLSYVKTRKKVSKKRYWRFSIDGVKSKWHRYEYKKIMKAELGFTSSSFKKVSIEKRIELAREKGITLETIVVNHGERPEED